MPTFTKHNLGDETSGDLTISRWTITHDELESILGFTDDKEGTDRVIFDPDLGDILATDGHRVLCVGNLWRPRGNPATCYTVNRDLLRSVAEGASISVEAARGRITIRGLSGHYSMPHDPPGRELFAAFDRFFDRLQADDPDLARSANGSLARLRVNRFPWGRVDVSPRVGRVGFTSHRQDDETMWNVIHPEYPQPATDWSQRYRPTFLAVRHPDGRITQGKPVIDAESIDTGPLVNVPPVKHDSEEVG